MADWDIFRSRGHPARPYTSGSDTDTRSPRSVSRGDMRILSTLMIFLASAGLREHPRPARPYTSGDRRNISWSYSDSREVYAISPSRGPLASVMPRGIPASPYISGAGTEPDVPTRPHLGDMRSLGRTAVYPAAVGFREHPRALICSRWPAVRPYTSGIDVGDPKLRRGRPRI